MNPKKMPPPPGMQRSIKPTIKKEEKTEEKKQQIIIEQVSKVQVLPQQIQKTQARVFKKLPPPQLNKSKKVAQPPKFLFKSPIIEPIPVVQSQNPTQEFNESNFVEQVDQKFIHSSEVYQGQEQKKIKLQVKKLNTEIQIPQKQNNVNQTKIKEEKIKIKQIHNSEISIQVYGTDKTINSEQTETQNSIKLLQSKNSQLNKPSVQVKNVTNQTYRSPQVSNLSLQGIKQQTIKQKNSEVSTKPKFNQLLKQLRQGRKQLLTNSFSNSQKKNQKSYKKQQSAANSELKKERSQSQRNEITDYSNLDLQSNMSNQERRTHSELGNIYVNEQQYKRQQQYSQVQPKKHQIQQLIQNFKKNKGLYEQRLSELKKINKLKKQQNEQKMAKINNILKRISMNEQEIISLAEQHLQLKFECV